MDMRCIALLGLLTIVSSAEAAPSLSCQLQSGQFKVGGGGEPKVSEFIWATGHGSAIPTGPVRTSIGRIDPVEGRDYKRAIKLDGKPVLLPPEAHSVIGFGKSMTSRTPSFWLTSASVRRTPLRGLVRS